MEHEQLLKSLIEIKSYSGEEAQIREFIAGWFRKNKIETITQGENLLVYLKGKDRTKAFIFNSHMDTVKPGNTDWKYGPWSPTREGEKLVGLGSSDMKSGLTASLLLARQMANSKNLPVDMWFTYVVNEEVDGSGTESFATWFGDNGYTKAYKDMAGIFTEPNGLVEVEYGHRGNFFFQVTGRGTSGHASRPQEVKGVIAVKKVIRFSEKLVAEIQKWNKEFPDAHFNPAITVGEFTSIRAGIEGKVKGEDKDGKPIINFVPQSINKFAPECVATFDFRTTPDFHPLAEEKLRAIALESDVAFDLVYPPAPAGFTDPKEKIVQIASTTGGERKLVTSHASADLGFLALKGVKSVILGPGEKLQAHMLDEYCYPDQIPQAVDIYKQIVGAWAK